MSATLPDYLLRLFAWGVVAVVLQGLVLLTSWWCQQRFLRHVAPRLRYRLVCAHLGAFLALPLLSVGLVHSGVSATWLGMTASVPGRPMDATILGGSLAFFAHILFAHAGQIMAVWIGGFIASGAMLAKAWLALGRVRFTPASPRLMQLVEQLCDELGLRSAPRVMYGAITAPYVTGIRRVVMVVPPDITDSLSLGELRCVLVHELAHLQRADFLWNLLQRTITGLLWFHPGSWLLYARARFERECCCDAVAVQYGHTSELCRGLLKLAANGRVEVSSVAVSAAEGKLERRFRELLLEKRESPRQLRLLLCVNLLLLLVMTSGLGICGAQDASLRSCFVGGPLGPIISIHAQDAAGAFELTMQHGRVLAVALEHRPVDTVRLLQSGHSVSVLSKTGVRLLALQVDPGGSIRWQSRAGR